MTDSVKATRATVILGSLTVDGFMLPDGSYRMSLTQAAECVGKPARGTFDFLRSKALKRLLEEAGGTFDFLPSDTSETLADNTYTPDVFSVDIGEDGSKGQTRIRGLPPNLIMLYWAWESFRGNKTALFLIVALATEALERRFDKAFGITRSEDDWNQRLSDRIVEQLESELGTAFAEVDSAITREKLLEQQLRELGVEPWALPQEEDEDKNFDKLES